MSKHLTIALVAVAAVFAPDANACEKEHPPAVTTPANTIELGLSGGKCLLSLAFDPRGVGKVAPAGDDADLWIDTKNADVAWDYREWQWWKGQPWGDSCRPRYYADAKLSAPATAPQNVLLSYRIDGFNCRQTFITPDGIDLEAPHWDVVTTIRNVSDHDVYDYFQFFACYTPLNQDHSFWYWDQSGTLVRFADRGVGHLDGYVVNPKAYFIPEGAIPRCPRGGGKIVGQWMHPLMVSHASPAGWRSIIMVEPKYAASLAQGIKGQAMDYILFPDAKEQIFAKNTEFAAHIRHVILKSPELPSTERLQNLWDAFQRSHVEIHKRAAEL